MEMGRRGMRWRMLLAPLVLWLGLSATMVAAPTALAAPGEGCLGPVAGQHIYDCAHVLSTSEVATLEADAAKVDQAGAPTAVYLQVKDATAQQTWQDAVDLMNRWDIESHPGAHDGFVMVFNLQPGNLRHGQVALFAGAKHYQHGNLPQAELDRIRTDIMTPLLADGQTAAGIAAGLQQVAQDLRYGPPPPPPPPAGQLGAANFGRVPFNVLALLYLAGIGLLLLVARRRPPLSSARDDMGGLPAYATPGELSPGMAGALVRGRVSNAQIEATVLDFARRGLLVLEPEGYRLARLRLVGTGAGLAGYENVVWQDLARLGRNKSRIVSSTQVAKFRQKWGSEKQALQNDLIERGWYDPAAAAARRRPLQMVGALGGVGIVAALVVLAMAQEGWAAIGLALCIAGMVVAFVGAHRVADTTVEGEIASARWRAYEQTVVARAYQPNLDTDLPYIVALGILGKLSPRLKAASERGYAPSWFRGSDDNASTGQKSVRFGPSGMGFYPYWIAFHTGAVPTPSGGRYSGGSFGGGSFGGGFAGGGAAGGGGGSAGGF